MNDLEFEHILIGCEIVLEKARVFLERNEGKPIISKDDSLVCEGIVVELHHNLAGLEEIHREYRQSLKNICQRKSGYVSYAASQGLLSVDHNGDIGDAK